MKLLVIDGNSIVNRAFYGIKLLTTRTGQYTNAITGFLNILLKLEAETCPDEVAIAFDLKAPTFRHNMFDGYKAQRKGMPEELAAQMPLLKDLLGMLGYKMVTCEGFEADDILGTLAKACEARHDICLLATGDRDSFQLVSETTNVLLASTSMGKSVTSVIDENAVFEKYGVKPMQLIDVKSLMGDTSDNIPGVAGIGEKTALMLIQSFDNLDNVYNNIDDAKIKKGVREKLLRDKEQAEISKELAKIVCDAPINSEVGEYKRSEINFEGATQLLRSLEMYKMIKTLNLDSSTPSAPQADDGQLTLDGALTIAKQEKTLAEKQSEEVLTQLPKALETNAPVYLCPKESDNKATEILIAQNSNIYTASIDDENLINLLQSSEYQKYCFDAKVFYKAAFAKGTCANSIVFDAKIAAYLLQPDARTYTVTQLAQSYGVFGEIETSFEEISVLSPLCAELNSQCEKAEMGTLLRDMEQPLCEVLASMEHQGILVDKKGIEDFGTELQMALDEQLKIIYENVGYEFNVNSPKQLGKALFDDLGLPTRKKTKSGYSTNAETLESLRDYHEVIDHILQYRTYQKLNSTYVEGLLKVIADDGRIHSTFNQTETRTGRISSGEPNLQNIPVRTELGSRFRKYFIAKAENTLLDADYSQIELRILADISGDETMRDAFARGADIHRSTAAKSYGVSEEEVTHQMRSSAKAVNFGIVYGISAFSLSKDIGVSVKEADAFIKNYFENFKGVKNYMDTTVQTARENGYVTTLYGRRRSLPELANSNFNIRSLGERMAMNTPIQGTAADIIKIAMIKVYNRLKKEGLQAKLILQVHDELIVECPKQEREKAMAILGEEMRNAASLHVQLVADVNCGETWYDAKG